MNEIINNFENTDVYLMKLSLISNLKSLLNTFLLSRSKTFCKNFSAQMLYGANEVEIGKQWASNKLLTNLSDEREVMGCLRRDLYVTVLFKQKSNTMKGDYLGRLVLGEEDGEVKIFGATIF